MKSPYTGVKRILKAFTYSYDGVVATFKSEAAFRQDILFCLAAVAVALCLPLTSLLWAMWIFALLFILLMELTNTAIEAVVDRIGSEYHELSKKAKDIGSALVLIAFINFFIFAFAIIYHIF